MGKWNKNSMEEPHEWVDHEEHSIRYVLKECVEQFYENEALDFFPRKLELFLDDSHSPMEKWDESTQFGLANNEKFVAISLITKGCKHAKKVHSSFPHVLDSETPMGNEQWVKTFFWFVSHTQQGDHDLSPWEIDPIAEEMDDYRSYKSERNIYDSSTNWFHRGITEEENMEVKIFMSCCKKYVFNIVDFSMIYKQQKRNVCASTFDVLMGSWHTFQLLHLDRSRHVQLQM